MMDSQLTALTPRPNVRELAPSSWVGLSTPPDTPESEAAGQLRRNYKATSKELPIEILLDVFDLSVACAVAEVCCGYVPWLKSVLSIGAVCHQWRSVMHAHPGARLWRTIYVLPIRCPDFLDWQLDKLRCSTSVNLKLEVHVTPPDGEFALSLRDKYFSNLKDLVSKVVAGSAGPSIFSRCNDIRIQGSVSDWTNVLCELYPFLPALDMTVDRFSAVCYTNTITKAPKTCPFPPAPSPFPSSLQSLTLNFIPLTDISWDWTAFTSLRSLDLYFHVRDSDHPDRLFDAEALGNLDVRSMHLLLQNVSQTLTTLRLGRWWTDMITPKELLKPVTPVVMPHLTDITVIWVNDENMSRLMELFSAPNLQRALLQDVDITDTSRWLSLPTFTQSWAGLECLIIRFAGPARTPTFALRRLLAPLNGLRRLHIQFLHDTWLNFYREYLQNALTDPTLCPGLVRFTFGYSSCSGTGHAAPSEPLGESSSQEVDSQSQVERYQAAASESDNWRTGTPTEPDSQPTQDEDSSQASTGQAGARLSRLETLMSVVSEPDLTNIAAALEETVFEEVPPFSSLTRQSSMHISFREENSQGSADSASGMVDSRGSSPTSVEETDSDFEPPAGSQTQEEGSSQEPTNWPSYDSVVADMALNTIAGDMAARRQQLPHNTLRVSVIPLRNFAYDRYH